eukprot:TRINITY_DN67893_c9_g4_i1.p2 TRINITY_DN67893_c9_g4~~TRINITY_DN67893_c9_g4_i1.p2  ORF type:complete len:117 (-),score=0.18 TRINITY_DN67893_c9_g4_i1:335-685(-)
MWIAPNRWTQQSPSRLNCPIWIAPHPKHFLLPKQCAHPPHLAPRPCVDSPNTTPMSDPANPFNNKEIDLLYFGQYLQLQFSVNAPFVQHSPSPVLPAKKRLGNLFLSFRSFLSHPF